MKFLIECDGPIFDLAAGYGRIHRESAKAVGWSSLDTVTFWRLTRTKGKDAVLLPGAKPLKVKEYDEEFSKRVELDETVSTLTAQSWAQASMAALMKLGACHVLTLRTNVAARKLALERLGLARGVAGIEAISSDPRQRVGEIKKLAAGDRRSMVLAATDALVRSAREAEVFCVGISSGVCTPARLHQAGADAVYPSLTELAEWLNNDASDLIRAGLPPAALP
ncbi:MAG: hypothetical protein AABZ47_12655 [Planctomycetota bacterium]